MPVGFEMALPSLINSAKKLGIEIPEDSPYIKNIYAKRDLKLRKIPMDLLHKKPTSLLFSLEGMEGLVWEKLLNFRFDEGSFLTSPSSTAYALQHTKDESCLAYLLKPVNKFNGGGTYMNMMLLFYTFLFFFCATYGYILVPNAYPVDMFEHLWCVDRLQRLGISRYFQVEIQECIDYVYRYICLYQGIICLCISKDKNVTYGSSNFHVSSFFVLITLPKHPYLSIPRKLKLFPTLYTHP